MKLDSIAVGSIDHSTSINTLHVPTNLKQTEKTGLDNDLAGDGDLAIKKVKSELATQDKFVPKAPSILSPPNIANI